jgi:hypothetical protein
MSKELSRTSAVIYPNGTLKHITVQHGDATYNQTMLALSTSWDDDKPTEDDFTCGTECASIWSMIKQVGEPLLDGLGCGDQLFELRVPQLPSQRFKSMLRGGLERLGCKDDIQERFGPGWHIELFAANVFDHNIYCEDGKEEQNRLYLILTHDRLATSMNLVFWDPPIGEVWRSAVIKRPGGELGKQELDDLQHQLNRTSTLAKKDVDQGRVWGRYDLKAGTRPIDRLFISGELAHQNELKDILQSLFGSEVVGRTYRELQNRDPSWNLWSGAAGVAAGVQFDNRDRGTNDLHSEL